MSEKKQETSKSQKKTLKKPGAGFAIPFFVVMAILTVVAFIIPLRPTQSYAEKRNLAEFPEFSTEALISGDYFDDISLWFSDTFPGREEWLEVSSLTTSLHGFSDIAIAGDLVLSDAIPPVIPEVTAPPAPTEAVKAPADVTDSTADTEPLQTEPETEPPATEWNGVNAGEGAEISLGAVIQIGDSAFNQLGYSQLASDNYIRIISGFADSVADLGVNVVSAPPPTAVGIMVEAQYLEKLNCADQGKMLDYMHSGMSENVTTVDTVSALLAHNNEYIYFRTDHHWTPLGAYYCYAAICEALGYDAAPLDSFEEWDQGEFVGSIYGKSRYPHKLRKDNLTAYVPEGDISMLIHTKEGYTYEWPMINDMTNSNVYSKYSAFLGGDNPISEITNESLPDGPNCVVIKDSFGNCFAPFLTQNYHKVYALDYRKFSQMSLKAFVEEYDIQDVIFLPYMIATQSLDGSNMFQWLCR